ncbi:MAG: hypothetical protein ER33_09870 [Cyanobium sp. CACIAM 14]|nr:MAG: hypothetical protein ER33_09870 [Cyanobium sp. CACIAM 14]
MAELFSIAFEQVELVNGLKPDQAVWLFMRDTLRDSRNPEVALDIREVGSFPPDANRALPPEYRVDDSGLYAQGLQIAIPARNDIHDISLGQEFPRFALDSLAVSEGQFLEVEVFMLPRVWFRQMTVSQDDLDKWSRAGFLTLLGASGFGLPGVIVGGILGGLWGTENIDVTVPCYQTVISARHVFTLDDLRSLAMEPMRRFGPNDNDIGICGYIDSFYWLSANQHQPFSFGPSTPIERQDCELHPWRHQPIVEWLEGTWLDRDGWETSCLGMRVNATSANQADVYVFDNLHSGGTQTREFMHRPILKDLVPNQFSYDFFGDECPARSAVPTCGNCKRFTNLPHLVIMPIQMIAALALGPRHRGAEGWGESMMSRSLGARSPSCTESERLRQLWGQHSAGETASLGPGFLFRRDGRDRIAIWPTGTMTPKPPRKDPTESGRARVETIVHLHDGTSIGEIIFGCFKVPLSEREALFTYAEVPAKGNPMCPRLRYMCWDENGQVVKDVMLQRWFRPPA